MPHVHTHTHTLFYNNYCISWNGNLINYYTNAEIIFEGKLYLLKI